MEKDKSEMLYFLKQCTAKNTMCQLQEANQCAGTWEWWALNARAKEGATEDDLLKQVTRQEAFWLMDLIVFIKISAASLNQSSMSTKAEENHGRHPKWHIPFQAHNLLWYVEYPVAAVFYAVRRTSTLIHEAAAAVGPAVPLCLSGHQNHRAHCSMASAQLLCRSEHRQIKQSC